MQQVRMCAVSMIWELGNVVWQLEMGMRMRMASTFSMFPKMILSFLKTNPVSRPRHTPENVKVVINYFRIENWRFFLMFFPMQTYHEGNQNNRTNFHRTLVLDWLRTKITIDCLRREFIAQNINPSMPLYARHVFVWKFICFVFSLNENNLKPSQRSVSTLLSMVARHRYFCI